jgi:transcriptional regulator with XRE-family HTH domain
MTAKPTGIPARGEEIRRIRDAAGMSRFDLRVASGGVSEATIVRAERGEPVSYPVIEKLARGLGVEIGEIFDGPPTKQFHSQEEPAWVARLETKLDQIIKNQERADR